LNPRRGEKRGRNITTRGGGNSNRGERNGGYTKGGGYNPEKPGGETTGGREKKNPEGGDIHSDAFFLFFSSFF